MKITGIALDACSLWQKKSDEMKKNRIEKRDRLIILKDRVDELKELELQTLEYDELEREYNMIHNVDRIARSGRKCRYNFNR